jgi:serine/threonine-protein kinase
VIGPEDPTEAYGAAPTQRIPGRGAAGRLVDLRPGAHVGPYELVRLLGKGGMGEVHLARDGRDGRKVALKLLAPDLLADAVAVRRFEREASCMARLSHRSLVRVLDAGRDGPRPYFAMEVVPGGRTLADALRLGLPVEEGLDAVEAVADALGAVHAARLVHRDVKPANVLLGDDGRARLGDFGIVRDEAGPRLTATNEVLGTPAFMAPEQLEGGAVGPWTDVYSLGALLGQVLGAPPPGPRRRRADIAAAARDRGVDAARALALEGVVRRACAVEPADRFQDVAALRAALRAARRVGRRARVVAPLVGGAVVVLALAATTLARRRPAPTPPVVSPPPARPAPTPLAPTPLAATAATTSGDVLPEGLVAGPGPGEVTARDGSVLVRVPAATFVMGHDGAWAPGEAARPDEGPAHPVRVDAFYLGKLEVTVAQYARFCAATGRDPPPRRIAPAHVRGAFEARDDDPVSNVTFGEARAYCAWAGLRLPTEAEWEYAARGTDGRRFPWGDAPATGAARLANLADARLAPLTEEGFGNVDADLDDGEAFLAPVGRYPAGASPFGCLDLAGNVAEWTDDLYGRYGGPPPRDDPGALRVVRGGAFDMSHPWCTTTARGALRSTAAAYFVGLRVAR